MIIVDEFDLLFIENLLKSVAEEEIISRFSTIGTLQISKKTSPNDLVTEADLAAEKSIILGLKLKYPNINIIGEESSESCPGALDAIDQHEFIFLIDPLDGTLNFANGVPLFGLMISILRFGETVAGIIYDPITQESAVVQKGSGAWIKNKDGNFRKLKVSNKLDVGTMSIGLSWSHFPVHLKQTITSNLIHFSTGFHFRTAALEYKLASSGYVDVLCYYRLKPWDHAVGILLHNEAGGYSAHFDGSQYKSSRQNGGLLVAPNKDAWEYAYKTLFSQL